MRRFVGLAILLLFTIPFGISISGCAKHSTPVQFCNGGDSGPLVGQVYAITLSPKVYGVSLNYGALGQITAPSATDCKGNTVSVSKYTYGTSDMTIADVVPTTGQLCAGTWNRNSGAGVADYTYCIPTNKTGTATIVASIGPGGNGGNSNPLPVYVHPTVTNVVLGAPSTAAECNGTDPATNCSPAAYSTSSTSCTINPTNGCCTTPLATSTAYVSNACLSQGSTGQLAARVYAGTGSSQVNVSCEVGHLTYTPQTAAVVTLDQNGVATAQAPGSTIITANLSNAGSSAGFFSTCPPTSIQLTASGFTGDATVNPNNPLPLNTVVTDKNGTILTGLTLEFVSTTPPTIPGASTITPLYPGAAGITAICQPPACNPSPFNQIGLFGNGTPVVSNNLKVTSIGKNSTDLYIASTNSKYIVPVDFTTNVIGSPVQLPYVPNSMVISNDGSTIYLGSTTALMTFSASTNSLSSSTTTIVGQVLAVSPDNTTLVITDPTRQLVYLYNTTGSIQTQYGGIGTHAEFTPDSQTVYITTGDIDTSKNPDANGACAAAETNISGSCVKPGNQVLVHSGITGWSNVTNNAPAANLAVTEPSVGAFLAGTQTTALGQCPITTLTTVNGLPSTTNVFYPPAYSGGPATDSIAATNDGNHIIGATAATNTLIDLLITNTNPTTEDQQPGVPTGACPAAGLTFNATAGAPLALPGVTATAITGVDPTSDSNFAFVTYSGTGGVLPYYLPSSGTISKVTLAQPTGISVAPIAPVAGVVSADNSTFFVGTSGDNEIHLIDTTTLTDDPTKAIAPNLPAITGSGYAVPNLLVQHPRKSTS